MRLRLFLFVLCISVDGLSVFSQPYANSIRNGKKLSHRGQKMVSGVNIAAINETKGQYLMTYIADNYSSEERYGNSNEVYVAIQKINLEHPKKSKYHLIAKRGMLLNNHEITSIPYNPIIGKKGNKYTVIFEGSIDNKRRGLLYRNVFLQRDKTCLGDEIDYIKVKIDNHIDNFTVDTYVELLRNKGYVTETPGCFVVDVNPKKDINGEWHLAIGCAPDNYILILKSTDFIIWEYEAILPYKGNETDLCYNNSRLFYLIRSGHTIFQGEFHNEPNLLKQSVASRPRLFELGNQLFAFINISNGKNNYERTIASIFKWNTDNSLSELIRLSRKETIQYYDIVKYKHNIFILYSTDPTDNIEFTKGILQLVKIPYNYLLE